MAFAFFVILNAILLIRPEELSEGLAGANLYAICICFCIFFTFPQILEQLTFPSLVHRPVTVCVIALLFAMALSQLARGQVNVLDTHVSEFMKVVLYFLLFMANVNTSERMLRMMGWIVAIVVALTTIGLLQYHGFIDIESMRPIERKEYDPTTGALLEVIPQLRCTGIYNDPNDLCLILVTGSICALCCLVNSSNTLLRLFWLLPVGIFGYGIILTQSRGGLLGFLAGLIAFLYARYGAKKCLPIAVILVPGIIAFAGGRMMNMDVSGGNDTAQERLRLWADGISLMLSNPLSTITGIGVGRYAEEFGLVAHNSFVHAFVELGLIGGTLFLGVFCISVIGLWKSRVDISEAEDPLLNRLHPFVFAIVIGYSAGAFSISRNFVVPTYMILAFAGSFVSFAYYDRVPEWFQFNGRMIRQLFILGILGLIFLKLFTQTLVQWG